MKGKRYAVEVLATSSSDWTTVHCGGAGACRSRFIRERRAGRPGVRVWGLGLYIDRRGSLDAEARRIARRRTAT